MPEQLEHIDGIDLLFYKSNRAKSINITIKPFEGVRVSVPQLISFKKAKKAVEQRMGWIKSHLSKMKLAENEFTIFDSKTKFKTREHLLDVSHADVEEVNTIVKDNRITVLVPRHYLLKTRRFN